MTKIINSIDYNSKYGHFAWIQEPWFMKVCQNKNRQRLQTNRYMINQGS